MFYDRLKSARKAASLSQSVLARLIGVTAAAIAKMESGGTKAPAAANLLPLARALNVDPEWLITGKGNPRPSAHASEPANQATPAAPDEAALLQKYRQMTPEQKQAMQTMGDAITQPSKKTANGGRN